MHHKPTSGRAISVDHRVLGGAIRELRTRRACSQEQLGLAVGLHRNYVGGIERGEVNPTFRTLLTVARGLDVPLSLLVRLYERRRAERDACVSSGSEA